MGVEAVIATQVIDTTSVGRSVMTAANAAAALSALGAQETLVSGTNIKTINSTSLLGSGDIAVSASPAGSSGQVQYNNAGAFGGMTAVVYAGSGTHLTITCQASTAVALELREAASQTVSPLKLCTSAGVETFAVAAGGKAASFKTGSFYTYFAQVDNAYGDRPSFGVATRSTSAGTMPSSFEMILNALGDNAKSMLCLGKGSFSGTTLMMTGATPGIGAVRGCAGSGTNIAGAPLEIASGPSTGNATPSLLKFQGTTVGSSGTTLQTLRDCLHIDGNTTAGETPMLLLDITAGTLKRVSIGASDSGGTGFKVLRVPN